MQPAPDFVIPNTLALQSRAQWGARMTCVDDLQELLSFCAAQNCAMQVVGEGSNIVAHSRVQGCVGVMANRGIRVLEETASSVLLYVEAGENWHQFVMHCLTAGWHGLENLALIPGTVGATPVQNIGAYGVEIAEFVHAVHVVDRAGRVHDLDPADCAFGYRDSVFKNGNDAIIHAVSLRLHKHNRVHIEYPELQSWLEDNQLLEPTPQQVAQAVIAIRASKLPDPAQVPNAGSFFKNPVVSQSHARRLQHRYPELKWYPQDNATGAMAKLSAAQLIDLSGGKQRLGGPVGCWPRQPLVLVNHTADEAAQVIDFAATLQSAVWRQFEVQLEVEPSLLS
ncbi:MAG: UDP-N-acetylmuramate dehydrogenase [Pseudomonadota bacterium]